ATIGKRVPGMRCEDIAGGTFGAGDGFIDPIAVMNGFTEGAVRCGAKIKFSTRVTSINVSGGKVESVTTLHGEIECDKVVLCTGANARELAATAGIDLPVEPQWRRIVWARSASPLPDDLPMVIDVGTGFHFRPARSFVNPRGSVERTTPTAQSGGLPSVVRRGAFKNPPADAGGSDLRDVLLAYPDANGEHAQSAGFDEQFIGKIYEQVNRRTPFLSDSTVITEKCRSGLYENTPDHHAILGGCEIEGLYFANGFSGHGVMHSPATGRALSEIILDGHSSFLDVSCLSIKRFESGDLLHESGFV
ncbi:MAG: FAD-binding oxidoreductase, partial [Acidobacteria bacterium]|nr:FAD-binding oxidoreductase [Acidobacteriota bacterium]